MTQLSTNVVYGTLSETDSVTHPVTRTGGRKKSGGRIETSGAEPRPANATTLSGRVVILDVDVQTRQRSHNVDLAIFGTPLKRYIW